MATGSSPLKYIFQPPPIQSNNNAPALIFLHGRGADENDLMGLAQYFDERLFVISVRAPYQWMYGAGYTWFDIEDIGSPDPAMFAESYGKLIRFLRDLPRLFPVDQSAIYLCGFSMGAMMSYAVALNEPELVKGIMALSGLIPNRILKTARDTVKIAKKPFFVSHGVHDSVIPLSLGRNASDYLKNAGADVTYREYDMDHQISEETLNDMIKWINDLLEGKRSKI